MRLFIQREDILKPLLAVSSIVEKRQTMPILSNILITANDQGVSFTGTDLEVEAIVNLKTDVEQAGEITVSARKLVDICKALPEGSKIDLAVNDGKMQIRSGRSKFNLATLAANEFPRLDNFVSTATLNLAPSTLKTLVDKTAFSMALQDVRYYLNGLLLEIQQGKLVAVGTDGHRLSLTSQVVDTGDIETKQVILPRKAVLGLSRLLSDEEGECVLQLTDNHIRLVFGESVFTAKLIDGRFPDYGRVIPPYADELVQGEKNQFRDALSRAAILASEKFRGVYLKIEPGSLWIRANNPDQEDAEEEVAIQYNGRPLEISFNAGYLLDAINALESDDFIMSIQDETKSCIIRNADSEDSVYVVMPMRL